MTIDYIKLLNPSAFSPVDTILEWRSEGVRMVGIDSKSRKIEYKFDRLVMDDESVDKVIIHCNRYFDINPEVVIFEAKRVLRKNGRIFLSFYHDEEIGVVSKWLSRLRTKSRWSMDQVAEIINKSDLLIDKNIIVENDLMYFEVIKLENEKLGRMIWS